MLAIISSLCSCKDITSCLTCSDEFKAVSMFSTWLSVSWATILIRKKNTFIRNYILNKVLDISLTPTNNGAQSRSGWTEIEQIYENVHPKPALVQLFERTEVECGKRLFREDALQSRRQRGTFSCCFRRRLGVGSCLDYTSKYTANTALASSLYSTPGSRTFAAYAHDPNKSLPTGQQEQGSYSFELFKFHDFPWLFAWPLQVFKDLKFSCHFQKFKTFTCFRALFDLKQFNRHKLWRSLKCVLFTLLNYSSLSYIVIRSK